MTHQFSLSNDEEYVAKKEIKIQMWYRLSPHQKAKYDISKEHVLSFFNILI